jgi:hypothetical protein
MTEQKKLEVTYLSRQDIEVIHEIVSRKWKEDGEPIPLDEVDNL